MVPLFVLAFTMTPHLSIAQSLPSEPHFKDQTIEANSYGPQKRQSLWQKTQTFISNHKKKIILGSVVGIAALLWWLQSPSVQSEKIIQHENNKKDEEERTVELYTKQEAKEIHKELRRVHGRYIDHLPVWDELMNSLTDEDMVSIEEITKITVDEFKTDTDDHYTFTCIYDEHGSEEQIVVPHTFLSCSDMLTMLKNQDQIEKEYTPQGIIRRPWLLYYILKLASGYGGDDPGATENFENYEWDIEYDAEDRKHLWKNELIPNFWLAIADCDYLQIHVPRFYNFLAHIYIASYYDTEHFPGPIPPPPSVPEGHIDIFRNFKETLTNYLPVFLGECHGKLSRIMQRWCNVEAQDRFRAKMKQLYHTYHPQIHKPLCKELGKKAHWPHYAKPKPYWL